MTHRTSTNNSATTPSPHEMLFNLLKQWPHCDVLFDREFDEPLSDPDIERALAHSSGSNPPRITQAAPINPKESELPPDRCLRLLRCTLQDLPLLDACLKLAIQQNTKPSRAARRGMGGWLFSATDIPLHRVARSLQDKVIAILFPKPLTGSGKALLRPWDAHAMSHLLRILSPTQMSTLMGPVHIWAWINRGGMLEITHRPEISTWTQPIWLSAEQDAALDRVPQLNQLSEMLGEMGLPWSREREQQLDGLLLHGQAKGYTSANDLLTYGLHAALISPHFDTVPRVAKVIAQAQANHLGLGPALAHFDKAFWCAEGLTPLAWPA